jgi:cohesin complex subunit SCC1
MLLADSCAGDPLNNSSKKKARRTGSKVIVYNETIIPKNVYMTWLDDPSSLVSKRRQVGEFQEDTGQLKLAHRLKKAQAAIVDTL